MKLTKLFYGAFLVGFLVVVAACVDPRQPYMHEVTCWRGGEPVVQTFQGNLYRTKSGIVIETVDGTGYSFMGECTVVSIKKK